MKKPTMKARVTWDSGYDEFYATTMKGLLRRARQLVPGNIEKYEVIWYANGVDEQPLKYSIEGGE